MVSFNIKRGCDCNLISNLSNTGDIEIEKKPINSNVGGGGDRESWGEKKFFHSSGAIPSIVAGIWLWLRGRRGSCLRRLLARERASGNLVYRDHMARKQGLKDTTPTAIFDEFPMIWAWAYSFLLWNRHPLAHAPELGGRATELPQLNYNNHTVFTRPISRFLSGGQERGPLKKSPETEWETKQSEACHCH